MITLGKRGDLHARRQAAAFVRNEIASENYDEATESILQLLHFKNCSLKCTTLCRAQRWIYSYP